MQPTRKKKRFTSITYQLHKYCRNVVRNIERNRFSIRREGFFQQEQIVHTDLLPPTKSTVGMRWEQPRQRQHVHKMDHDCCARAVAQRCFHDPFRWKASRYHRDHLCFDFSLKLGDFCYGCSSCKELISIFLKMQTSLWN